MAMTPGTKKWATLATWTDQTVYNYFRAERGQTPRHAGNSVGQVRAQFDGMGRKYPKPIDAPRVEWLVLEQAYQAYRAPSVPTVYNTPGATSVVAEPAATVPVQPEPTPVSEPSPVKIDPMMPAPAVNVPNNLLSGLAHLLAPELVGMLRAELEAAVAGMAPVVHRIVVTEKLEVKLPGLTHRDAEEVIRLSHRKLNVLMKGAAGTGKTSIAKSVALSFNKPLVRIAFSAGLSEAALLGRLLPVGANGAFRYIESDVMRAYRTGEAVILFDEIDAADSNMLVGVNALLDDGGISIEARAANGEPTFVERHPDTIILAAANTWGSGADTQYVGRAPLDKSTLDRFFPISVDYDPDLESALGSKQAVAWVHGVRAKARAAKLQQVVSTRMIIKLDEAVAAGLTFDEAKARLLAPWSADERAKVGA